MSVFKKLQQARITLQNMKLEKSGHNKFAGYKYFELADFMPAINTIFNDIGLCGVVSYDRELACLTIYDTDNPPKQKDSVYITSPMADANLKGCHPIQNLGAVETYTRRYLWVTAMEIVEHDAIDSSEGTKEDRKEALDKGKTPPPNESAKSVAGDVWDKLPDDEKKFLQGIADTVIMGYESFDIETAVKTLEEAKLDADEKVAIWSRFDSKLRSAIKTYNDNLKKDK